MKMQKSKINVIKVPNNNVKSTKSAEFPRMPRMYLELIENKDKIKPSLVNKEYDPDEVETVISTIYEDDPNKNKDNDSDDEHSRENENVEEYDNVQNNSENEELADSDDDEEESEKESDKETEENDSDEKEDEEEENNDAQDIESEENESEDNKSYSQENDTEMDHNLKNLKRKDFFENAQEESDNDDLISENLSLSSKNSSKKYQLSNEENLKKNATRERLKEILKEPPKLSDLEKRGEVKTKKIIPNIENIALEEEDELKRELLYKFELLKKSYKNIDIPDFTMHSDYKNMNKTYENTLRRVSLDSNVENYKNYLIAGFMILEYVLGFWLKFDMAGFTQQQMLNINQYERLLIELGEKSYVPDDKKWPVELRLLGMIIMNAVIFIIAKIILNKTGTSLFGFMNSQMPSSENKMKTKRKMKGPNIDISSIPNMEEISSES